MRILFDQGTPLPLRRFLTQHEVSTAYRLGWSKLSNGELLAACEGKFDLLITTDKNLKYQQQLKDRSVGILILPTTNWAELKLMVESIARKVDQMKPGEYLDL